jgi:hypothetical protein
VTAENMWLDAFPIRPAAEAVEAIYESWQRLASVHRPGFHPLRSEPDLTRVLKAHVEYVTARERGLLGMWVAEGIINEIDLDTAELTEERRTDIVYGWNNDQTGIQLVFEFKKIDRLARSRTHYLGENGLGRFVTGIYSRQQAIAAMVGILMDPIDEVVPPLRDRLADSAIAAPLKLRLRSTGGAYDRPSLLFPLADFDTEHERDPKLAPSHGTIRVAHLFFSFGYTMPTKTKKQKKR